MSGMKGIPAVAEIRSKEFSDGPFMEQAQAARALEAAAVPIIVDTHDEVADTIATSEEVPA